MSERYTSGSVGRFGFPEANLAMEAADAMVGRMLDDRKEHRIDLPRPIIARLTADLGDIEFDTAPNGYKFRLWNWEQVTVTTSGAKRAVVLQNGTRKSTLMGDYPRGRAVQINNASQVGDHVVLFRLMQNNGFPFYAFAGTRASAAPPTSLLKISTENPPEPISGGLAQWKYNVMPIYWDGTPRTDAPAGIAYNLYEKSSYRDQPLAFSNPDAELTIIGPIKNLVFGTLATRPDLPSGQTPVWVFEAVNPMSPACDTEPGVL